MKKNYNITKTIEKCDKQKNSKKAKSMKSEKEMKKNHLAGQKWKYKYIYILSLGYAANMNGFVLFCVLFISLSG